MSMRVSDTRELCREDPMGRLKLQVLASEEKRGEEKVVISSDILSRYDQEGVLLQRGRSWSWELRCQERGFGFRIRHSERSHDGNASICNNLSLKLVFTNRSADSQRRITSTETEKLQ